MTYLSGFFKYMQLMYLAFVELIVNSDYPNPETHCEPFCVVVPNSAATELLLTQAVRQALRSC